MWFTGATVSPDARAGNEMTRLVHQSHGVEDLRLGPLHYWGRSHDERPLLFPLTRPRTGTGETPVDRGGEEAPAPLTVVGEKCAAQWSYEGVSNITTTASGR